MRQFVKNKLIYALPPIAVIIIMLAVYAYKGMYPFGNSGIPVYDLLPAGYHGYLYNYDVLHGLGSFFYDFTTAGGFQRSLFTAVITPGNLFLYFFPREMLYNALSYLLVFETAFVAFTSFISFKKIYPKLNNGYAFTLSMLFSFSMYTMQYYSNIAWLDSVALFPLCVAAAISAVNGKSKVPFILLLTYVTVTNTYFAFFYILFFILFGGLYVFILLNKTERKSACFNLGASVGTALIISAYSIYDYIKIIVTSSRYSSASGDTSLGELLGNEGFGIMVNKLLMFSGLSLCITCIVILFTRFKSEKKHCAFFACGTLLLILQSFVPGTDLLWHGGSYVSFPFRNGFIIPFFLCCAAGYCLSKYADFCTSASRKPVMKYITLCVTILGTVICAALYNAAYSSLKNIDIVMSGITINVQNKSMLLPALFAILPPLVLFLFISFTSSGKLRVVFMTPLLVIGLLWQPLTFVVNSPAKNETYIGLAESIASEASSEDYFSRMNNSDFSLKSNYGYVLRRSCVSNWTHLLNDNVRKSFTDLGFSACYTRLVDNGGTVFSHALLNIVNAASAIPLDRELFSEESVHGELTYYSANYTLPVGLVFDDRLPTLVADEYDNLFEYQNSIYASLSGDDEPLFERSEVTWTQTSVKDSYKEYKTELSCNGNRTYYCYAQDGNNILSLNLARGEEYFSGMFYINGEPLRLYVLSEKEVSLYRSLYSNNIIGLGSFQDESVTLDITTENGHPKDLCVYSVDLEKMRALCDKETVSSYTCEKESFTFTSHADNDGEYLFIPLNYCDNFEFTNNGEAVEAERVLGNFIGIRLHSGENVIEMHYNKLTAFTPLIYVALVGMAVAAVFLLIKKRKTKAPPVLEKAAELMFKVISASAVIILYVAPLVLAIYYETTH